MTEKDDVAGRLKKIREALKLKQKEIAQQLNISSPSYSELEAGKYKPRFELISKLSREFNVNLYYLMFGEGDMFLGPVQLFSRRIGKNVVNKEEIDRFLNYFENSPMAQFMILGSFRAILNKDKETIEKEVEEHRSKK